MRYYATGCRFCGELHAWFNCHKMKPSDAPLETPSHNGEYQGDKSKIRVLAPGVSGEDGQFKKMMDEYRKRGGKGTRRRWGVGLRAMHAAKAERKAARLAKEADKAKDSGESE